MTYPVSRKRGELTEAVLRCFRGNQSILLAIWTCILPALSYSLEEKIWHVIIDLRGLISYALWSRGGKFLNLSTKIFHFVVEFRNEYAKEWRQLTEARFDEHVESACRRKDETSIEISVPPSISSTPCLICPFYHFTKRTTLWAPAAESEQKLVDVHWKLILVRLRPCLTLEDTDKLANHKWKGRKK